MLLQQFYELQSVGSKLSTEEQEAAGKLIRPQVSTHDAEAPGKLLAAMVAAQEVINAAAYRALGLDTVMLGDLYRPALDKAGGFLSPGLHNVQVRQIISRLVRMYRAAIA